MTNQDEVLKLAEAAGFEVEDTSVYVESWPGEFTHVTKMLTKLIALAKQSAYEDAAKLCEQTNEFDENPDCWGWHSKDYSQAIRNRANEVTK